MPQRDERWIHIEWTSISVSISVSGRTRRTKTLQETAATPGLKKKTILNKHSQFTQLISNTSWWYTYPSEKYESQLGWICSIDGRIKVMFQTTNQNMLFSISSHVRFFFRCLIHVRDAQRSSGFGLVKVHPADPAPQISPCWASA